VASLRDQRRRISRIADGSRRSGRAQRKGVAAAGCLWRWQDDVDLCAGGARLALPAPRCGHLNQQSLDALTEAGVSLEGPVAGMVGYYRPHMWGEATPVRYVIAPQYQPDATYTITPMTQAETAALLMKASFFQRRVDYHQQWQAAIQVSGQTRGWRLTYGSLREALDMIDQLTAGSAQCARAWRGMRRWAPFHCGARMSRPI